MARWNKCKTRAALISAVNRYLGSRSTSCRRNTKAPTKMAERYRHKGWEAVGGGGGGVGGSGGNTLKIKMKRIFENYLTVFEKQQTSGYFTIAPCTYDIHRDKKNLFHAR